MVFFRVPEHKLASLNHSHPYQAIDHTSNLHLARLLVEVKNRNCDNNIAAAQPCNHFLNLRT